MPVRNFIYSVVILSGFQAIAQAPEEVFKELADQITSEVGFQLQPRNVSPLQEGILVIHPPKMGKLEVYSVLTVSEWGSFRLVFSGSSSRVSVLLNENEYLEAELSVGYPNMILESQYEFEGSLPIPSFQGDYEISITWEPTSKERTLFLWVIGEENQVQKNVAFRSEWDFTDESLYKYRYIDDDSWSYPDLLAIEDLGEELWNSWSPYLGVALEAIQRRDSLTYRQLIENHLNFLTENSANSSTFSRRVPPLFKNTGSFQSLGDYALQALPFFNFTNPAYDSYKSKALNHLLYKAPKHQDGTLVRKAEDGSALVVCEDLYASVRLLCKAYETKKLRKYLEQAIQQVVLFNHWLKSRNSGLYARTYAFSEKTYSIQKPSLDNGWALLALVELLQVMPETHPERLSIIGMFQRHAESVREFQNINGFWKVDLGDDETTDDPLATGLIVSAYAIGAANNWLFKDEFRRSALSGWLTLLEYKEKNSLSREQQTSTLLAALGLIELQN